MIDSAQTDSLFVLRAHPQSPDIADTVELKLIRNEHGLQLQYTIKNAVDVLLPARALAEFTDDLWKHTCCEIFIRPEGGEEYIEFNFSPSSQWAVYGFSGYRSGMHPLNNYKPVISTQIYENDIVMEVAIEGDFPTCPWNINVATILENKDGKKAYFALTHLEGAPNFHAQECFTGKVI